MGTGRRLPGLAALLWAALAALPCASKELSTTEAGEGFSRLSLSVKAERVVYHRKPYLLLRIRPHGLRAIDTDGGGTTMVVLKERGLGFLPVTVACARMQLRSQGRTFAPEGGATCRDQAHFENENAGPVFVSFPYPPVGPAEVVVPVTVSQAPPPIETRLVRGPVSAPPKVPNPLVGEHALVVRLYADDPAR